MIAVFVENPKRLFLTDALGACLTAFLLAFVLARFESFFGMPPQVLFCLSIIAACYAAYSVLCFLFITKQWKKYLSLIIAANFLYACLTLILVVYYRHSLTFFGALYFFIELIVMSILIITELKTLVVAKNGNYNATDISRTD